jgi:DeoR family transcriptional regulator, deoxyribose operon repressor
MPSSKRTERLSLIVQMLQEARGATISDLAGELKVSEMTVRRDLEELAAENRVRLIHAAAIPVGGRGHGLHAGFSLADESADGAEEKMRIGRKASSLIEPGDIVIIDSGATTEWLAHSIPPDMPATIICFALNILLEAARGSTREVVFAGGALRGDSLVFQSPEGVSLLRRYRATKAFLSASGVSERLGVTCEDAAEGELKKAAIASSQTRILLADSNKFSRVSPSWFADLSDFDAIITDAGISLEYVEILRQKGIALHVV